LSVRAVLVDLDGTLIDTAPDLVAVLNRLLDEQDRPPMPFAIARNEVSNGALGLLRLGFGSALPAAELEALRTRFLQLYTKRVCVKSRLFIDIESILHKQDELSAAWGIVTNKPHAMTMPLLERLGIDRQPACIVSGDRLPQRKPHPAPLELAARELDVRAADCVYVGDAERDIQAGRAAGMHTIAVTYGYIRPHENPYAWGADAIVRRPLELLPALVSLDRAARAA
jgi:phosphoglycolate phosphatase